jgi:Tfp pilus assembly protein PilN
MVRINLLPAEVLERRRWEKWYPYALFVFAVLLLVILIVYGFFWFSGAQKNTDLQLLKEQTQKLQATADAFAIFEQKEQELAQRQAVGVTALANRINMGRLGEEVSLVLPDEVWLETMGIDQTAGLTLAGFTPWSPSHSMDVSYKSVAKTLVRVNELKDVSEVWLTNASDGTFSAFTSVAGAVPLAAPVVKFSIVGKVTPPASGANGEN